MNNQNNISHKAYFKPNTEFKKLWATRPTNLSEYTNTFDKVKNKLPSHQLEIIESTVGFVEKEVHKLYLIFNNTTKKAFGVAISGNSKKNHLLEIFDSLLDKNDKTEDFFKISSDTFAFEHVTHLD